LRLNTAADQGPVGTATGLFTGSLIGLLGGPIGLAVGAASGAVSGLIFDISSDDINTTFVDEVSNALTKGKTAVIAEIDETGQCRLIQNLKH
jgi:Predicted membrane protein